MQTGRAIGQGQSVTAKNLPAEIIKLTEFFPVGFELHPDKHFDLLPVSFFWKICYLAQYPLLYCILCYLKTVLTSNNFAELFSCQH